MQLLYPTEDLAVAASLLHCLGRLGEGEVSWKVETSVIQVGASTDMAKTALDEHKQGGVSRTVFQRGSVLAERADTLLHNQPAFLVGLATRTPPGALKSNTH